MAKRTDIRTALQQLLVDQGVLAASKILLGKFDKARSDKLPLIRIFPAGTQADRSSQDSFDDEFTVRIEAEAKHTSSKDLDTALEEFEEAITEAIRSGSTALDDLLHDYQVISADYTFDGETQDQIGSVVLDVECMIKP